MARVICDCAVSAWDSQVSAGKQDKELFSFWPRVMVWKNTVSHVFSASLFFLCDMTWLAAGRGDPVQRCCLPTPDHPAPQQRPPPDAAATEDQ